MERNVRVCSNLEGLSLQKTKSIRIDPMHSGWLRFAVQCLRSDLVIIDNAAPRLFLAAALRSFGTFRLVSVDLIIRKPRGLSGGLIAKLKTILLWPVDKFILYFRNIDGLRRHYGIGPDRAAYVPFKINGWNTPSWPSSIPAGDYVLCAGRTLRDLDTFVGAVAKAGVPAMLLQQQVEIMKQHGTVAWERALPANVRVQIHDGELDTFLAAIAGARIVVIPRFAHDICATGISTYLAAMAMGKAVIISRGPGAEDLLHDEAFFVEPENVPDLTAAISRVWKNEEERKVVGEKAKRYAVKLGDTNRLNDDIIRESVKCLAVAECS
jgi:glycosyltransferase involved in cell wall biosynthesis